MVDSKRPPIFKKEEQLEFDFDGSPDYDMVTLVEWLEKRLEEGKQDGGILPVIEGGDGDGN